MTEPPVLEKRQVFDKRFVFEPNVIISGDASGRVTGSYTIQGADGQSRRVEYVADENGFRYSYIFNIQSKGLKLE